MSSASCSAVFSVCTLAMVEGVTGLSIYVGRAGGASEAVDISDTEMSGVANRKICLLGVAIAAAEQGYRSCMRSLQLIAEQRRVIRSRGWDERVRVGNKE
jgi:hypothetical protein